MAAYALSHEKFPFHYKERIHQFFRLVAPIPSLQDGLIPKTVLLFPAMAPAYIPMLLFMGIRAVNAWKMESPTALVNAVSPPPMLTGDGRATRKPFISVTLSACSAPITQISVLTFPYISASSAPGDMPTPAPSSPCVNQLPRCKHSSGVRKHHCFSLYI